MLKIDIRSLSSGVHDLRLTPTPEEIGVDEGDFADLDLQVRLDIGSNRLYVRFTIAAKASLVCDRTMVDFVQSIRGSYSAVYVPPEDIPETKEDGEKDNLFPLAAGAEDIDLTELVRDTLLLAVPVRKVAPGAEEEDIPTTFGEPTESDIDPRWSALKDLKSNS